MDILWLLIGVILCAVVISARKIVRDSKPRPPACVVPLSLGFSNASHFAVSVAKRKRHVSYLSMAECAELVRKNKNVLVMDIRSEATGETSLPFPLLPALTISPGDLDDVLRWVPADQCVLLCGEVGLCSSVTAFSGSGFSGSAADPASVYVLKKTESLSRAG